MVTTPAKVESVEDVLKFIPENDLSYYSSLDEDEIKNGSVCSCGKPKHKYISKGDSMFYQGDKQGIAVCDSCGGYYGVLIPNH